MSVVVIGNGESRKGIDIPPMRNDHTLIGCNAIHRDFTVDHLVCCDRRMVEEAVNNERNADTYIHVRDDWYHYFRKVQKNKNIIHVPNLPYVGETKQDDPIHWGSGCYAVLLGATLGHNEVILLGFDLFSDNSKVNNVYKDTINYSKSDSQSVDPSYWIYQIGQVFKYFPLIKFTILNKPNWIMPREWQRENVYFQPLGL